MYLPYALNLLLVRSALTAAEAGTVRYTKDAAAVQSVIFDGDTRTSTD
jgi:hypothetical protein